MDNDHFGHVVFILYEGAVHCQTIWALHANIRFPFRFYESPEHALFTLTIAAPKLWMGTFPFRHLNPPPRPGQVIVRHPYPPAAPRPGQQRYHTVNTMVAVRH